MKRFLSLFFAASLLLGCSSSAIKVNPLVKEFLVEHIANPDTYKPGITEVIDQGTIRVENTFNWQNIPEEGTIDVVVLRHEFTSADKAGAPADNAFIFYMNPALDVLYYAHKDKGVSLFTLE